MNAPLIKPSRRIIEQIRARSTLRDGALLHAMRGVHPIDVKEALVSALEADFLRAVFFDSESSKPVLHEIKRDDNPVLNFWPFTNDTAQEIAQMCLGHKRIALFGVPTVYSVLKGHASSEITLFDSDDYHFRQGSAPDFVKCDLVSELPGSFENEFDLVVADPPWYLDEYHAWFDAAIRLLRPGGEIIFVLFPEEIRDTATDERDAIFSFARGAFDNLSFRLNAVNYETPSFEQVQMLFNGIQPINWRCADLIVGRLSNKSSLASGPRDRPPDWIERRIGCGRIFVRNLVSEDVGQFLSFANTTGAILASPSRRALGRDLPNILSSRGHGLLCNDPNRFVELVSAIKVASDIDVASASIAGPSRNFSINV